jgi:hypothetical protein
MPLLDHFHPPLSEERSWEGFHSALCGVAVSEGRASGSRCPWPDRANSTWPPAGPLARSADLLVPQR